MEGIKTRLSHDYNLAVRSYNEKDHTTFFRNIRPSIELLTKLLIYDLMDDELDASGIVDGNSTFMKSGDGFELTQNFQRKPQGKVFAQLAQKAFCYMHPEVTSKTADESLKRIKRGMDGCCSECARFYDIASGLGNHTDGSALNEEIQAAACATFLMGFIDFLRSYSIISSDTGIFLTSLEEFSGLDSSSLQIARDEINTLVRKIEEKETELEALRKKLSAVERIKQAAENTNVTLNDQISEMQRRIDELLAQLDDLQTANGIIGAECPAMDNPKKPMTDNETTIKPRPKIIDKLKGNISAWDVDMQSMDDDQLDLLEINITNSMLVTGCAGSGKSIIAMHKAEQIAGTGASVILIAFTRSLSAFMREGINTDTLPYRFCHHHYWKKKLDMMKADYIIVDEIQDFTKEEIQEFMAAANKAFFFFGDSAQSIYRQYGKPTVSIEEISAITGLTPLHLYNNYRLPKSVARITQDYVGVNVNKFEEKVYQNKEKELPHIVKVTSIDEQVEAVVKLVGKHNTDLFDKRDIGILVPSNELVKIFHEAMDSKGIECEFKYSNENHKDEKQWSYVDTLDFSTSLPKIMTYHSAKGLQFDVVILPMYNGAHDNESRKALYVAMTRTTSKLYVFYTTEKVAFPLDCVPTNLYKKTI